MFRALVFGACFFAMPAALAADLLSPKLTAPSFSWTGLYAGAQAGGGFGKSQINDFGLTGLDDPVNIEGFFGGGVLGGQWQWKQVVFGAEGEFNFANIDGITDLADAPGGNFINSEIKQFGSVSGRLGRAFDRVLLYGTGGIAFAKIETGQRLPIAGTVFSQSRNYVGWTLGAGLDFAASERVIVGAQYRYYDFGRQRFTPAGFSPRDQRTDLHTVSGRVTVKFGNTTD